jgi:hypothetical protein
MVTTVFPLEMEGRGVVRLEMLRLKVWTTRVNVTVLEMPSLSVAVTRTVDDPAGALL